MKQPFKKITLPNGLRIILVPRASSMVSSMLVLVEAGGEYEPKHLNGISHFLEHLMFKGTMSRPRPEIIAEELDALGAQYNAFTAAESTGYWAKAESHKLPQIIDLISDLYLNPIFDQKEIEKERGVMVQEINMHEDVPADLVVRLFPELLYGDQPAGWTMEDEKRIIGELQHGDFKKYRAEHYVAPKTIVVVAGAFNKAEVVKKLKALFGGLPKEKVVSKVKAKPSASGPRVRVISRASAQTHMVLGMRAFPFNDPRRPALKMLCNILGGGMSSRLWLRVREELGAAYEVSTYSEMHSDHGNAAIFVGAEHAKFEIVLRTILDEMKKMTIALVPEKELQKAKDHMIGNFILNLETVDELAEFYAYGELRSKHPVSPDDVIKQLRAVTREDVRNVARVLFKQGKLHLAVIGPELDEGSLKKLLVL